MYIDPTFGGVLFQVLLIAFGVISGAVLIFSSKIRMGFARLMRSLRERRERRENPNNDADPENNNRE